MGRPIARRLVAAGHDVRVLARSAATAHELTTEGFPLAADATDVADADAVLVCVLTDEQVRDVCLGTALLDAMPPGSTVVVHTTASPTTIQSIVDRASPRGVAVVDAPVSGGPHDIAAGHITLFVGGRSDVVERIRPVLASYADPVLPVGPPGAGQRTKLVNNALFAAQIGLIRDAVRLGGQLGLDETVLLSALGHGSAASRALAGAAARGSVDQFARATAAFLDKDLRVVRTLAAELDADLGALEGPLHTLALTVGQAQNEERG
jgi:3-hydroxyisobutyrate dehydrogenase-like beta-hydroxyacid dehydrogenase